MTTTTKEAGAPASSTPFQLVDRRTPTEVNRQEIQAAIAKAMELRSLHAALLHNNSPSHLRLPTASPLRRHVPRHSAQDYPVFTPNYVDVPRNQSSPSCWEECSPNGGGNDDLRFFSDHSNPNTSSRILLPPELMNIVRYKCPSDDYNSVTNPIPSPRTNFSRSRRNSLGDFSSITSVDKCKTASLDSNRKSSNLVVPMTDSHSSGPSHSKPKSGKSLSWLIHRLHKKKHKKIESSPPQVGSDESSFIDAGMMSVESLKKELTEANKRRDMALTEVSEMRSSIGGLQEKLEYLENYCEELNKALGQAKLQAKDPNDSRVIRKGKHVGLNDQNMPVSNEVMAERFTQMVSEARSSVKQFCKALVDHMDEGDAINLNSILQPQNVSLNLRNSRAVLGHLEAVINQSLYQDFENCVFQKNGCPKLLDPQQEREARFLSFCTLRNLSWNEVLRKGTKYYSEEFSRYCDQRMSGIVASLNWTQPWPEQLLQTFFVAAKCVWLLHLLAFSFSPALGILRVGENRSFDSVFMEDEFVDTQRAQMPTRVKVMVMPGFYVQDRVLKCKVLCRYKTAC